MRKSISLSLGVIGLAMVISGCQNPYKTGNGSSTSGASTSAAMNSENGTPVSPAGSLQACLDSIGDASPGQRMLAEGTCKRNAKAQESMDSNPGNYLPAAK